MAVNTREKPQANDANQKSEPTNRTTRQLTRFWLAPEFPEFNSLLRLEPNLQFATLVHLANVTEPFVARSKARLDYPPSSNEAPHTCHADGCSQTYFDKSLCDSMDSRLRGSDSISLSWQLQRTVVDNRSTFLSSRERQNVGCHSNQRDSLGTQKPIPRKVRWPFPCPNNRFHEDASVAIQKKNPIAHFRQIKSRPAIFA
jgi:hypothetical protein